MPGVKWKHVMPTPREFRWSCAKYVAYSPKESTFIGFYKFEKTENLVGRVSNESSWCQHWENFSLPPAWRSTMPTGLKWGSLLRDILKIQKTLHARCQMMVWCQHWEYFGGPPPAWAKYHAYRFEVFWILKVAYNRLSDYLLRLTIALRLTILRHNMTLGPIPPSILRLD